MTATVCPGLILAVYMAAPTPVVTQQPMNAAAGHWNVVPYRYAAGLRDNGFLGKAGHFAHMRDALVSLVKASGAVIEEAAGGGMSIA